MQRNPLSFTLASDGTKTLLFEDSYQCVVWRENPEVGEQISLTQYLSSGMWP